MSLAIAVLVLAVARWGGALSIWNDGGEPFRDFLHDGTWLHDGTREHHAGRP